jgi:hypothetical protein
MLIRLSFLRLKSSPSGGTAEWDKAASILEQHRGEPGFMDLGSHADVRKHKRRYAEYRIDRTLLTKIETNLRKHRTAA